MSNITSIQDIRQLLQKNDAYRDASLNLIASENVVSPAVAALYDNSLIARYGCYETGHLENREYTGNRYIYELEAATQELAGEVFHAKYADLRPLSGHTAGLAAILAVTPPGQCVLEYHLKDWGHGMMGPACDSIPHFKATLKVAYFKFLADYQIDLDALEEQLDAEKPASVVLGSSGLLFPEPVAEVKKLCEKRGIALVADVSHVSGLIAGGVYPNPLDHGADLMFLSTHKSFPGPQGGMILSNDESLIVKAGHLLSPGMVTSHHVFRLPPLAGALLEIKRHGHAYGAQIIKNSQALGAALDRNGIPVVGKKRGYSQTHIVLAETGAFGSSREIALQLERAGVFVSDDFGSGGGQIRLGTAEVTRRGMKEPEMEAIGNIVAQAIKDPGSMQAVAEAAAQMSARFRGIKYAI